MLIIPFSKQVLKIKKVAVQNLILGPSPPRHPRCHTRPAKISFSRTPPFFPFVATYQFLKTQLNILHHCVPLQYYFISSVGESGLVFFAPQLFWGLPFSFPNAVFLICFGPCITLC